MTPNGDGVNDVARLEYGILEITGKASVRAEVMDLVGRRLRLLLKGAQGTGQYHLSWDGRDGAGRLVPPGAFLIRVSAQTDVGHAERTRVLYVVY
jgi:flagellar hook assembly protein FlgD